MVPTWISSHSAILSVADPNKWIEVRIRSTIAYTAPNNTPTMAGGCMLRSSPMQRIQSLCSVNTYNLTQVRLSFAESYRGATSLLAKRSIPLTSIRFQSFSIAMIAVSEQGYQFFRAAADGISLADVKQSLPSPYSSSHMRLGVDGWGGGRGERRSRRSAPGQSPYAFCSRTDGIR